MNLITVGVTGLRTLLFANDDITDIIATKIFRDAAPGDLKAPYILIHHLAGGEGNRAPSRDFDMIFRIESVSPDQVQAETLADLIEETLIDAVPTFPDGWTSWANITGGMPHSEPLNVQNIPHYRQGSQYRVRATKS